MGRIRLITRLVARDLRRRRGEAVLMLIAIMAASATLTLGLILHGVTSQPYTQTRTATLGPGRGGVTSRGKDARVIAPDGRAHRAGSRSRGHRPRRALPSHLGTTAGPRHHRGRRGGRPRQAAASLDQPKLTQGTWVRPGELVIERSFADALGVGAGARITLNGRSFRVAGVAVTAAFAPYPNCLLRRLHHRLQPDGSHPARPGLGYRAAAHSLATTAEPLTYFLNLKLAHPGSADAFANAHNSLNHSAPSLTGWQDISLQDGRLVANEQMVMMVASWLLCLLAVASVAVLVAGRVADQIRRVGLLKAVGATPGLVAAVFLAEYLVLALVAGAAGLAVGWLVAPLLTSPGAGLLGTAGAPPMTLGTIAVVAGWRWPWRPSRHSFPPCARPGPAPCRPGGRGPAATAAGLAGRGIRAAAGAVAACPPAGLVARRPRRVLLSAVSITSRSSGSSPSSPSTPRPT